jgi:hypothetical protein
MPDAPPLSQRERAVLHAVAGGIDPQGNEATVQRLIALGLVREETRLVLTQAGKTSLKE